MRGRRLFSLDEPLTSFDVVVALEIKNLLREIKHDHVIVFSTHILQLATDLCDEIVILHDGRVQPGKACAFAEQRF